MLFFDGGEPLGKKTPHPARDGWRERPSRSTFSPPEKENRVFGGPPEDLSLST